MKRRVATLALFLVGALYFPANAQAFGLLSGYAQARGSGAGQAFLASGVAVDPAGTVYLLDYGNNRVSVFSAAGTFVRAFGKKVEPQGGDVCTQATGCKAGVANAEAGALNAPVGIDLGPDGLLYVGDRGNNRISVFSADGTFVRAFGKGVDPFGGNVCTMESGCQQGIADGSAGSLSAPAGMGINSVGTVYVAGSNNRIDVFSSSDGNFISAFGNGVNPAGGSSCTAATGCQKGLTGQELESAGGISEPRDVAIAKDGTVAVTDSGNYRIDVFSSDGNFIRAFGEGVVSGNSSFEVCTVATQCHQGIKSDMAGGLASPLGLTMDGAGNLLIADTENQRVAEFKLDGTFLRAFGEGVVDGKSSFEICTMATGCSTGHGGSSAGAIPNPTATAVDCRGAIYATTFVLGGSVIPQVERFGESGTPPPPCESLAPPPPPPPPGPIGGSGLVLAAPTTLSRPTFTIELNSGSGTATLTAVVSGLGTLWLHGKGIHSVKRRVKRIGLFELLVVPKGAAKRELEQTGKTKVKVVLSFKPDEGRPSTQVKVLTLKMASRF